MCPTATSPYCTPPSTTSARCGTQRPAGSAAKRPAGLARCAATCIFWEKRVEEQAQDDAVREALDELIWRGVQAALDDQWARGPRSKSF
jgi:hypothetical protein